MTDAARAHAHKPDEQLIEECREAIEVLRQDRNLLVTQLAEARASNARLNRRCQTYEAGLAEKMRLHPLAPSFGRLLAIAGVEMYRAENEKLRARITELEGTKPS